MYSYEGNVRLKGGWKNVAWDESEKVGGTSKGET